MKKVLIEVDEALWAEFRSVAASTQRTVSEQARTALRKYLGNPATVPVSVNPLTPHHVTPRTKAVITNIQVPDEEPRKCRCGCPRGLHQRFSPDGKCERCMASCPRFAESA